MTDRRGIVISTPTIAVPGELSIDSTLDQQSLRFWLLFWDELRYPEIASAFRIELGHDADWLEKIGILTKFPVQDAVISMSFPTDNDKPEEQYQYHFLQAYNDIDQSEPGVWSLATGAGSITLDEQEFDAGRGMLVRLHKALPVPHRDVPFEDLLKFKDKRQSELLALRHKLEEMYQTIRCAPDAALAVNTQLNALDVSLSDYLKAARSSSIGRWVETDIGVSLEIARGVNVAATTFMLGLPPLSSAVAGAAASVKLSAGAALRRRNRDTNVPWRYVAHYLNEI